MIEKVGHNGVWSVLIYIVSLIHEFVHCQGGKTMIVLPGIMESKFVPPTLYNIS